MKVHFLRDDALEALRINLSSNIKNYSFPSNEWVYDYFRDEQPFKEFKREFNDFNLTYNPDISLSENDVNNAIMLYSAMKSLSDTEASDERIWAGMCHSDFWNYMILRYNSESGTKQIENTKARFFFAHSKRRSLFTNALSRLWWIGRLTYNESRKDPFELTRYFENDFATKSLVIFSNNFMGNLNVTSGMISALLELQKDGFEFNDRKSRDIYYEVCKYLNVFGGTYILDFFTEDEIKERVVNYMWGLIGKKPPQSDLSSGLSSHEQSPSVKDENFEIEDSFSEDITADSINIDISKSITETLSKFNFEYIDNESSSDIIWVIYDASKIEIIEQIKIKYEKQIIFEKRGSIKTRSRAAWRIMCKNQEEEKNG